MPQTLIEKRLFTKEWRKRNIDHVKAYSKEQYTSIYKNNTEARRRYNLKKKFGITPEIYQQMLDKQNNVCAICCSDETAMDHRSNKLKRLAIDHCHTTGRIRGLLCVNCNHALGKFKDSITIMEQAIKYLKENENSANHNQ